MAIGIVLGALGVEALVVIVLLAAFGRAARADDLAGER